MSFKVLASSVLVLSMACVALVFLIWGGSEKPAMMMILLVVLESAFTLGMIGLCFVVAGQANQAASNRKADIQVLEAVRHLEDSVASQLDAVAQGSKAQLERVEMRLRRHGRRIEKIYVGIEHYLGSTEPKSMDVPVPLRFTETSEILDQTNIKLDRLQSEMDQSSKRLREHSAQLRLVLEEHSKLSSTKVLAAKAAVIEEILEGIDSLISQGAGQQPS